MESYIYTPTPVTRESLTFPPQQVNQSRQTEVILSNKWRTSNGV